MTQLGACCTPTGTHTEVSCECFAGPAGFDVYDWRSDKGKKLPFWSSARRKKRGSDIAPEYNEAVYDSDIPPQNLFVFIERFGRQQPQPYRSLVKKADGTIERSSTGSTCRRWIISSDIRARISTAKRLAYNSRRKGTIFASLARRHPTKIQGRRDSLGEDYHVRRKHDQIRRLRVSRLMCLRFSLTATATSI